MLTLRLVIHQARLRCTPNSNSKTYIKSHTLPCQQESITWSQHDFLENYHPIMCGWRTYTYGCKCAAEPRFIYCDMADKVPNGPGKVDCGSGVTPGQAHVDMPNNFCKKHWKERLSEESAKQEGQPKDPTF